MPKSLLAALDCKQPLRLHKAALPQRMWWRVKALRPQKCDSADAWLQVRNTQGQEGGFCKVGLRLKAYPDNPIQCVASACQFKEGSGKIQCKDAQCACGQGTCPGARSSPAPPVCWPAVQGL